MTKLGFLQDGLVPEDVVNMAMVVKDSEKILQGLDLPTDLPSVIPMQEDLDRHDTPMEKTEEQMTIQEMNYYIYQLNKILPPDDQIEEDEYPYFYTQMQDLQVSAVEMPNLNLDQKQTNLKRSKLMKGPNRTQWIAAEDLQIEQYQ
jgi:hypothetical protein